MPDQVAIQSFIERWQDSGAAECAKISKFVAELCDLLETRVLLGQARQVSQGHYMGQ